MALILPNSVFIHVPKTGGTWVRQAIANAGIPHVESGPFEVHDHYGAFDLPPELHEKFTFGFVRHPVNWLASRWAWAILSGLDKKAKRNPAAAGHWMTGLLGGGFQGFVEGYLAYHAGVASKTQLGLLGFNTSYNGQYAGFNRSPFSVSFTGRYERLSVDLREALDQAGERYDPEGIHRTEGQRVGSQGPLSGACQIPANLRQRILDAERPLVEMFGYK